MSNSFYKELFNLENKVAVVTGGGGHLCGEFAIGLAKAGCKVVIADIRLHKAELIAETIKSKISKNVLATELDATDKYSFQRCFKTTLDTFGDANILINGAGINSPTPFFEISQTDFDDVIKSQIVGTLLGCQVFGQYMVEKKCGSIINISSASAGPPLSNAFAYSIAKSGILSLTQNLGREWGTKGVRVNAIRPGFFPTEWNKKHFITEAREAAILSHTPMERFGKTEELIGGVIYLASDAASFVTGSEITVDGGFSCMTI